MKASLSRKFIFCYILIGITGFLLVTGGGSRLIEKHLEHSLSESFYQEAVSIASNETVTHNISSYNLDTIQESLTSIAIAQDTEIWILNNQNEIIVNTDKTASNFPAPVKSFDPTAWGGSYYQIGDFYGFFSSPRLSVIAPITADMSTKGYVAIHYQMRFLYQNRSGLLKIMQILFLCIYLITLLLLLLYHWHVQRPLSQIIRGTTEFAGGNLSYKIPVTSDDEMGYLANMLNYMAEKLNRNGEYQRHFIANISHDFRSPLTSIKGYVEAMLDGTIPAEMQGKYLNIISFEANRLEKLTRSLLTLNDLDVQKRIMHKQKFDINQTIKTTAEAFEGECTKHRIRLELILSGTELFVNADMEQIQQVLYNLLDNAVKFSDDESSIEVETTEKNDRVFISVKDHGCGIPKNSLSRIWDRFYKTDVSRGKDRKGTGLGLSIVKEIINAHDQNIDVVSTEGIGTEFIFTLEKA